MFAHATQQARAVMDTPALQPIGGMQALMMRPTEVELVRECFRWLFNDDDGDLKKRQGRVEMFADQVNGRFRRRLPFAFPDTFPSICPISVTTPCASCPKFPGVFYHSENFVINL